MEKESVSPRKNDADVASADLLQNATDAEKAATRWSEQCSRYTNGFVRDTPGKVTPIFAGEALRGSKVLVVEDDADSLEMLETFLAMLGLDVVACSSAEDAWNAFRERRPDVVVSDVNMPGKDGFWLIQRIRSLTPEEGGLTPAVALTGGADIEATLRAGFHAHLTKPLDPARLVDVLRDFVGQEVRGASSWTVTKHDDQHVVMTWSGHVNAGDMRDAMVVLLDLLHAAPEPVWIVTDLRQLVTFAPAAPHRGQRDIWKSRGRVRGVIAVGGTKLTRLVTRTSCLMLGLAFEERETWP